MDGDTNVRAGWLLGIGALLVLLLVPFAWFLANCRDEPAPADGDLALPPASAMAEDDNAWHWYQEADSHASTIDSRRLSAIWRSQDHDQMAGLSASLGPSNAFVACLDRATACAHYAPPWPLTFGTSLPPVRGAVNGSLILAIRSEFAAGCGAFDAALDDVERIARMGRHLSCEGCEAIPYMVGLVVLQYGCAAVTNLAWRPELTDAQLARLAKALPPGGELAAGLGQAARGEYWREAAAVTNVLKAGASVSRGPARRGALFRFSCHPNAVRRWFADLARATIANVGRPYTKLADPGFADYASVREHKPSKLDILRPNAVGQAFIRTVGAKDARSLSEMLCRTAAQIEPLRVGIACIRFRRAKGAYPKALKELVPEYLEAVPADPYDGAPLRYDAAAGRIWSRLPEIIRYYRDVREREMTFLLPK